jgi:F0F1-type ATP synthase assembly protein I
MLMLFIAGLLVVFPALIVILWFIDRPMWILPAVVSFSINLLPFLVAIWLLRKAKQRGEEFEAH